MTTLLKIKSIAFAVIGVISLNFSYKCSQLDVGYRESKSMYGGDAYTGIQNAGAQTADNVFHLNNMLRDGFTYGFALAGLTLLICAIPSTREENTAGAMEYVSEEKQNKLPPPVMADAAPKKEVEVE